MDKSASERWKALCRIGHIRGPGALRATVSNALLTAALALILAGCGSLQPTTTVRTIPLPQRETKGTQQLASAPKQPEALPKPAPPAPQQPRHVSEVKPPPATVSKGAEKLAAPNVPFTTRASEKPIVKTEPAVPPAPIIADSSTVTDAPVAEFIFKGPPHEDPPRVGTKQVLMWSVLVVGVVGLAILARLFLIRRGEPVEVADAKTDDFKMPPELLFKEPMHLPQD